MSQKRQPEEEAEVGSSDGGGGGGGSPEEKRQKVPALRRVIVEAVKMDQVQKLVNALEPLVRRVVQEEVERALKTHLPSMTRQCGMQIHPSNARNLQLQFRNKLSLPIFTGTRIEGEDFSVISIALVDALSGEIVMSGPESSMKVEIVVLEGDFEGTEEGSWTLEEFKNNIVREREGKRSLLTGDVFLDLNEGIGIVGELSFTDNSSWTRSRKFRLGARSAASADSYFNGVRIQEAKTEAFMVKDHRGELYKKHYPPVLWDDVWRLEKIGKDGAFHRRLSSENINTVKDFLTLLTTDATKLRNILGSGMSAKMWEVTVEHARTCILTNHMHVYYSDNSHQMEIGSRIGVGVVFNVVGEVMGLLSENHFVPVNELSETEKADAHILVKLALEHWNDVVAYDDMGNCTSSLHSHPPTASFAPGNVHSLPNLDDGGLGFIGHSAMATPDIFIECGTRGRPSPRSDNTYSLQAAVQGMGLRYFQPQESSSDNLLGSHAREVDERIAIHPAMLDECRDSHTLFVHGEDNLHFLVPDATLLSHNLGVADSPADLGTAITSFLAMSASSRAARDKANTVWGTLISVLKWRFSIKKIIASKKRIRQRERFG